MINSKILPLELHTSSFQSYSKNSKLRQHKSALLELLKLKKVIIKPELLNTKPNAKFSQDGQSADTAFQSSTTLLTKP